VTGGVFINGSLAGQFSCDKLRCCAPECTLLGGVQVHVTQLRGHESAVP